MSGLGGRHLSGTRTIYQHKSLSSVKEGALLDVCETDDIRMVAGFGRSLLCGVRHRPVMQ